MKKFLRGAMAVGLAASMTACASQQTPESTTAAATEAATTAAEATEAAGNFVAGTYSGSDQGFGGKVTVTITTTDAEITDVQIEGKDETPTVGGAALEELASQIKTKQSAEIDGVSGATLTSNGVKAAAAAAIEAAKKGEATGANDAELAFTAGTYTGKGTGYNGDIAVDVTFDEGKVTAIEVKESKETEHVGDVAYDILIPQIIEANGTGVDGVSGATFSSRALKEAVNDAADQASVTNKDAFTSNTVEVKAQDAIDETYDVVVVGAGGAGISAAAQAAQDGNTVLVIEKNAEVGGNTLVSGGQYQSVMPYLVWDAKNPDATTGKGFDGNEYNKVKSVQGCIDELKTILNWSEDEFDADYYKDHEYVAGDIEELSKHGVVKDYLPTLQALKKEIQAYLDWAQPKLDAGTPESDLTLFSTINLHIFQTYYGGLRQSADKSSWIYGDVDLVSQFINDGQDIKPWLESMGSTFVEDTQPTLIGALWYRENQFIGANVDADGDGKEEEYGGRWGTYFMAPMTAFKNANEANKIMTRTTAEELITENGRVTGVKATMFDGTPVTAHATKGVILATGGFAANIGKVVETNEYWSSEFLNDKLETTNRSSLQGDGIKMAEGAGAATTGEGFTQLMPISWVDNGDLAFGGGDYAIYINPTTGNRFVDETSERDVLSLGEFKNGIEWKGHKGVFIEIANAAVPIPGPYLYKDEDVEGRQYVRTIGELADLFKEIGLETDADAVIETIKDYDQAIMSGKQPKDVTKKQFSALIGDAEKNDNGSYKADTYNLDDAKLRVRLMAPSTHHTMGGISVDVNRHVLDKDGKAIDGLYAAGEVTGGIHGGNRLGGNAITEIFVSGRTAAKAVTADNK
ncbi:FMN-binding protein [Oribacterium sp. C9]|uniref:FAD-dependent oxidoreductase n=1 Tax=Oribacterium sp. C9 TaxID=1943579 RepID=UPI0009C9A712|nr:FAD-dependent oxidoreductase [Oribacterium sp. C9]OON87154.1 FMN-binding protein [Oribacterium sp. C9]